MEGPTPVSALIHAATMVTAGVYLIARMHPLFEIATDAALVAAIVGCATMLFASSIALVQNDLKRVIAYSTMGQIGYMIMGVAAGAYAAGMFHLMTHAFFKALLFMAAGSVIAAMGGTQDIRKMGGMRKAMPFTFWMFLIGALTLAGFPLLSGFFSKDEIISYLYNRGDEFAVMAALGLVGALMTAFYSLRMLIRVFFGEKCEAAVELEQGHLLHGEHVNPATGEAEDTGVGFPGAEHHIAEREWGMKLAMGVLAVLCVISGALQVPAFTDAIEQFLLPSFEDSRLFELLPSTTEQYQGLGLGSIIALLGIFGAYFVYLARPGLNDKLRQTFAPVYKLLLNKYYFDELYNLLIVRPFSWLGGWCDRIFERFVVDGVFVGWTTTVVEEGTRVIHKIQNGLARSYAALVVFGIVAVSLYFYVVAR
jgi:NADH-quinone oxidoreductase subunit L